MAVPVAGALWRMTSLPQMHVLGCFTPVAHACLCAALTARPLPSLKSLTLAMVSLLTSVLGRMPSSSLTSLLPVLSLPPATVSQKEQTVYILLI